ncbi:MAG: hypothetical protein ABIH34_01365 [Nanoarchaeota archaeon]
MKLVLQEIERFFRWCGFWLLWLPVLILLIVFFQTAFKTFQFNALLFMIFAFPTYPNYVFFILNPVFAYAPFLQILIPVLVWAGYGSFVWKIKGLSRRELVLFGLLFLLLALVGIPSCKEAVLVQL